jgi:hypothetical protein
MFGKTRNFFLLAITFRAISCRFLLCEERSKLSIRFPGLWTLNSTNGLHSAVMTPQYPQFTLGETAAALRNQVMDDAFVSGKTKTMP